MRRRFAILTAGAAAAVLAVAGIAGVAAQTSTPEASTPEAGTATSTPEAEQSNPLSSFVERLADNLGVTPDELTAAVEQTRDELVDEAVANGDLAPEFGEAVKEHDLDELLKRFGNGDGEADGKGFGRHFDSAGPGKDGERVFRHDWFGFGGPSVLAQAADVIGVDVPALIEELSGGKTLAEVAAGHGVSRDELKQGLAEGYSADLDEWLDRSFEFGGFHDNEDDEPSATPSLTPSATPAS